MKQIIGIVKNTLLTVGGMVLVSSCLNSSGGYMGGTGPGPSGSERDLSVAPDFSALADFAMMPDLSAIPDLSATPDLSAIPDLSVTPDLSAIPDLSMPDLASDLAVASDGGARDMATGPADAAVPVTDPFDPASCSAPALTSMQALALLGAAPRLKLADATLYSRSRSCTGGTPATCGPFGTPVVHTQALLTYSGGVTTDYKTFSFPTHLILFAQAGMPKWVIRHESDYRHDATANTRGVVFPVGADPMVNTYPIIYVWDFAPKPSRYEDLQGKLLDKAELHVSEHCARVVFSSGLTSEIAALYRY